MAKTTGLVYIEMDKSENWDYLYLFENGGAEPEILGKRLLELMGEGDISKLLEYLTDSCTEHNWFVLFAERLSFDPDIVYGMSRIGTDIKWQRPDEDWQNEENLRKIIEGN